MSQGTGMNYRSLAGNMVVAFAAQGISFLASVAMSLLVPKVLGVETYGYWQLFFLRELLWFLHARPQRRYLPHRGR